MLILGMAKRLNTRKLKSSLTAHIKRTVKHNIGKLTPQKGYNGMVFYIDSKGLTMFSITKKSRKLDYNFRVIELFADEYDMSLEETLLYTKDYVLKRLGLRGYNVS